VSLRNRGGCQPVVGASGIAGQGYSAAVFGTAGACGLPLGHVFEKHRVKIKAVMPTCGAIECSGAQRSGPGEVVEPTVGGVKPKKVLVNKWTLWAWALYVDTVRMTRGRRPGSRRKHDIGMIWKQLAGMKPGWREIKVLYSSALPPSSFAKPSRLGLIRRGGRVELDCSMRSSERLRGGNI
jgi:hypothetical protein